MFMNIGQNGKCDASGNCSTLQNVEWSFNTEQYQNIMLGGVGALLIIISLLLVSINAKLKTNQKSASEIRKSDYTQSPQPSAQETDTYQSQDSEK